MQVTRRGLSADVVEALRMNQRPTLFDPAEQAVHDFASEPYRMHRISDEFHVRVTDLFGPKGAFELTGMLGYHTLISMTINACDGTPPEGAETRSRMHAG